MSITGVKSRASIINFLVFIQVIQPNSFLPAVLSSLDDLRTDLSISRSRSRLSWGHPVPGDDTQTVYVWLDALVNYLTVAGYPHSHLGVWKDAVHVIGENSKVHLINRAPSLRCVDALIPSACRHETESSRIDVASCHQGKIS